MDITALATALDVDPAYIRRILDLANLSPALVEAIFRGEEPDSLSLMRTRIRIPGGVERAGDCVECFVGKLKIRI